MNEKDDNKQFQQDPVQHEINERLKYARYKVPNQKKVRHKYENMQTLLAGIMALGILFGLIAIIIQLFMK